MGLFDFWRKPHGRRTPPPSRSASPPPRPEELESHRASRNALARCRRWVNGFLRRSELARYGFQSRQRIARLTLEYLEDRTLFAADLLLSGFPTPITAGTAGTLAVTAQNTGGTTDTAYTGTVHFSSSDGQAGLPADYTFTSTDAGVHTFSVTLMTAGTESITATDATTSTITGTQTGIGVNPAAATQLVLSGFPASATAGTAGTETVKVEDAYGNVVTGYTGTVHFTSSDAQAGLPADYTFTSTDAGVHTFSVTLKTAGIDTITATDTVTGTLAGSQTGITITPAAASTFVVSGFPASVTAGTAGSETVTAKDAYGNTATGYTGTVQLTSSDAQAALPANYTFTSTDAGSHVFSVTLKTAGTQSVTATDTATSTITGSQAGITVTPAAASTFVVSGFPTSVTAGAAGTETVTAKDAYGNVATGYTGTVQLTSSDAQAALPVNYTFTAADAGAHTFSITLKTAGAQSVTATDTVTGTITGSQTGISVAPAAASAFVVSGFPTSALAGTMGTETVTAKDAYGNVATGYVGTIRLTSSDGQAVLPANYTFTSTDAGSHAFSVTLKTAGGQSVTATDTASSGITGSQTGITVTPAAASSLVVSGFPTSITAGAAGTEMVTAKDAYGNVATGYAGTVTLASSDAQAALPANYTFTTADNGAHTFSVTLKTAGAQSLTATDTLTASLTGSQAGIAVSAAAASSFVLSGFPASVTAGTASNETVTAKDAYGNVATGYTGTVHLSSSDAQAGLPANYTFTSADAGAHAFSVTLKTAGSQSLAVTDTVTSTITGAQTGITVTPAAASTFVVSGLPASVTAGTAGTETVTAKDAYGNTATGYTGTVHLGSSDAQAALPANYTFTTADNGAHTFSITLKTAGSQSVTATDIVTSTLTGSQAGISVTPAAASAFVVSGIPASVTAGTAVSETVTAKDAYGNTATGYAGIVHLSSSDAQAALPANYTFTTADAGAHTFSVTLKTAGAQSLTATDTVTASLTASQAGITVTPAGAATLVLSGFPSPLRAGVAGNVTVTAEDAYGNTATAYTGTVHLTSSDAQATLPANYTFTSADAGVHGFGLTLQTTGTQSITATDTASGSITGSQTGIIVNPASGYSVSGNAWPNPALITISFAPDGTVVGSNAGGNITSNLFSTFNAKFGSAARWENIILKAAQTWAAQTNINFALIPDSGAQAGSGPDEQGDPTMGDIRISGYNFGSTALASTFQPPPVNNYSIAGDLDFNTGMSFNIGTTYDLYTVALHEIGHALGADHSTLSGTVMYPYYQGTKTGLTSDDVKAIRAIYSNGAARSPDQYNGGASPSPSSSSGGLVGGVLNATATVVSTANNVIGSAVDLTSLLDPNALTGLATGLNLNTAGQQEYFAVTAPASTSGTFTAQVQSQGLSLLAPSLTVYAADQVTVLGSASGLGQYGTTLSVTVNNVTPGQRFYVEVTGADKSVFSTGAYALELNFGSNPTPVAPTTSRPVAAGAVLTTGGGQAIKYVPDTAVNTDTADPVGTFAQGPQAVAMDGQGNYVVTWAAQNEDGSGWGVFARRWAADGTPLGTAFQVNTTTAGDQTYPSVAMNASGAFVVTWSSNTSGHWNVYAQRYDSSGNALGGEFQVNTTPGDAMYSTAAVDANGDFVISWSGNAAGNWNVYARTFNASGVAGGNDFQVNATASGDQEDSSVSMDQAGDFVVAWAGDATGTWQVYAQRYAAGGTAQGGAFQVSTGAAAQATPSVSVDQGGDFVITWTDNSTATPRIMARRYAAGGSAGNAFQVNAYSGQTEWSRVSMGADGSSLITWSSSGQDDSGWGIFAQQYDATGATQGYEFQVNNTTAGDQNYSSVAIDGNGHAVVVWSGNGPGSTAGIFSQRGVGTDKDFLMVDPNWVPDDGPQTQQGGQTQTVASPPISPPTWANLPPRSGGTAWSAPLGPARSADLPPASLVLPASFRDLGGRDEPLSFLIGTAPPGAPPESTAVLSVGAAAGLTAPAARQTPYLTEQAADACFQDPDWLANLLPDSQVDWQALAAPEVEAAPADGGAEA